MLATRSSGAAVRPTAQGSALREALDNVVLETGRARCAAVPCFAAWSVEQTGRRVRPATDLRRSFTAREDHANTIEPSEVGWAKLVDVFASVCRDHDFTARRAVLYP